MNALFLAALAAGLSYWPASHLAIDPALLLAWKGAGVGLLALWAAGRARGADGWLLTAVLALGAAGDVLLEVALTPGGAVFLCGHLVAIALYLRNRRAGAGWWPLLLVPVVGAAGAMLPADPAAAPGMALYGIGVAAMAACAAMSRFRLAAAGALMFTVSDLLIFARLGPLTGSILPSLLVWSLYFLGQALIAWDVGRRRA
ncbi:lysoplasmalogenase [Sphingomonas sp. MAH-20]|uniref:Lysoplasmalogenase n=1 Tax=Sphingomonas horti TaxID=2682842 RepID=A0A6I4IW87_9SPHN|nr:lysoplasmalogenase family protein [Sphingomonas sp. CGMCC 1.13658]MBA2920081.1 lysoplasmalogenase [Sphingomonas sp. CGMCC 1.13658]MVO76336.1 lysoplasmalogenase [Sphingomonas horti]